MQAKIFLFNEWGCMTFNKLLVLSVLSLGLSHCATSGREFPSKFDWIQKGKTRQQDAKLVLGDPQFVGSSDGQPSWTYGFYKYRLLGQSTTKELKLYWSPDKTVQTWSFNSSFPEDTTGVSAPPPKAASDVAR
jgi:hypothetical protein